MNRKQISYGFVAIVIAFSSCHSPAPKGTVQNVQKKDTGKAVPPAPSIHNSTNSYVILDTVVKRDTIKVVLFNNTMIRCSINQFSDTYNAARNNEQWDTSFSHYLSYNIEPILIPHKKKPIKFILNDTLLIIPVPSSAATGGMLLFLLNRTKKSLTFSTPDDANPVIHAPCYIYVDLKSNIIIDHNRKEIYDDEENAGDGQYGRFLLYRYKISGKHFVLVDVAASYLEQFNDADFIDDSTGSHERVFYNYVAGYENWQRDRYDSSSYQKVVSIDAIVGKNKIMVYYDNKGNVICNLNDLSDTVEWHDKWLGYESWRNTDAHCIIVPGENTPRAFIVNDSIVLFTIISKYGYPVLFMLSRADSGLNFSHTAVGYGCSYIYVDLKINTIIDNFGQDYQDYKKKHKLNSNNNLPDNLPYWIYRYKIAGDSLLLTNSDTSFFKEFLNINDLDNYDDSKTFYNSIVKNENWVHDQYHPTGH